MKLKFLISMTVATALLGGAAFAQETMDAAQLDALVTGNTLYVDIPAGAPGAPDGGTAPIYYGVDGSAAAQLPAGPKLVGTGALDGDQYCIDWENGPQNSCTQLMRTADGFVVMDANLGEPRGLVTLIAVGNPEDL
ncbi:hypothetical protein [uncultured Tateyamaria sp.]|uniref:hypothetical protein n=1 Tax=uncultured Tateyamaria sp. TaxID=455651 RepID=UPI00260DB32B|nr:hypothetical protein [uncultured Tateyamaria sp.]